MSTRIFLRHVVETLMEDGSGDAIFQTLGGSWHSELAYRCGLLGMDMSMIKQITEVMFNHYLIERAPHDGVG